PFQNSGRSLEWSVGTRSSSWQISKCSAEFCARRVEAERDHHRAEWRSDSLFPHGSEPRDLVTVGPFLPDVRTDPTRNVDAVLAKTSSASIHDQRITTQFR